MTQCFGFGPVQLGFACQQLRLGEGVQVGGDQRELDPDSVDVVVPGGQMADAGVLPGPDPVLNRGVRPVSGLAGKLSARKVCWW